MSSRDEFEKWFLSDKPEDSLHIRYFETHRDGSYVLHYVQGKWTAWQASREQVKKECIEACEKATGFAGPPDVWDRIKAIEELE